MSTVAPDKSGAGAPPFEAVAPRKKRFAAKQGDAGWRVAIWFLLPALIGFVIFYLYPAVRGIYISFTDWNLLANTGELIGADNYTRLWSDPQFWASMRVTGYYVILNIGLQTVLSVVIAVMMDRLTKSVIVRGVLLLPWLMPNVVVALLWLWMLDGNLGVVNDFLGFFSVGPINFFTDTSTVIPTVAGINVWRHMGYTALLIFAGLQTIPKGLYEAGALDGSTEAQMFRSITIPLLRPILALVLVITIVGSFQVFDTVAVATGGFGGTPGGPANASRVIYLYIFQNAFDFNQLGYAGAISVVLLIVLLLVAIIQMKMLRAGESDLAS